MPPQTNRPIIKRSSYCINNAIRFLPIYTQAVVHMLDKSKINKDIIVPFKNQRLAPGTMKQRITDGLRWIIDHYNLFKDHAPESLPSIEYLLMLRGMIKFRHKIEGIIVSFPTSRITPDFHASEDLIETWKDKIESWLASSETILRLINLDLTTADIQWVRNLIEGTSIEISIDNKSITMVKS